ncbi:hypothetical protein TSOC_012414, partial [Tetrabaena socialis]
MALRAALAQLVESASCGVLGLNRSCWGASTSADACAPALGRLLGSLSAGRHHPSNAQHQLPAPADPGSPPGPTRTGWPPGWPPSCATQWRGYKSNKRSLKPLNTAASWQAVQPLLASQRQRQRLLPAPSPDGSPSSPSPPRPRRPWSPRLGPIIDTCLPPIPPLPCPPEFSRVGSIMGRYAPAPERVFAVVQLAGTQFK